MSFFSKLFGGGAQQPASAPLQTQEYKGFKIVATPFKEGDRWQVCGVISRTGDGASEEEKFIRADSFPTRDDALEMTFFKARQMIDLRSGEMPR